MQGHFGDLLTAMVTPFDREGKLDLDEAQRLAAHLVENGSDGLVVTGSTGESPTLTDDEKISLYQAVVQAVGDRASVVAGSGTYSTDHSIHLTQEAEKAGVDGALIVTPYYNRPPQEGLLAHFRAVAGATGLKILLYDIPSRTSRKIEHATLVELASTENIVGVKDACGDAQGAARLVRETPDTFHVYSGNDADTLPWLAVGAVGVIAVASHVVGPQMAEMISLHKAGDAEGARKIHLDLMEIFDLMALTTNPIPVKAAVRLKAFEVGEPRLPLLPANDEQVAQIEQTLRRAGAL